MPTEFEWADGEDAAIEQALTEAGLCREDLPGIAKDDASSFIGKLEFATYWNGERFAAVLAELFDGKWFPSNVAGVSHRNADRTSRQAIIKKIDSSFETIYLEHEPDNEFDPNAVQCQVFDANDFLLKQIGFLNARVASEFVRDSKRGYAFHCFVLDVTGEDEQYRGVNIALLRWEVRKDHAASDEATE